MMMMVISGPAVHQPHEKMHAYTSNPLDCQKRPLLPGPELTDYSISLRLNEVKNAKSDIGADDDFS